MKQNADGKRFPAAVLFFVRAVTFRLVLTQVEAAGLRVLLALDLLEIDPCRVEIIRIAGKPIRVDGVGQRPARRAFDAEIKIRRVPFRLSEADGIRFGKYFHVSRQRADVEIPRLKIVPAAVVSFRSEPVRDLTRLPGQAFQTRIVRLEKSADVPEGVQIHAFFGVRIDRVFLEIDRHVMLSHFDPALEDRHVAGSGEVHGAGVGEVVLVVAPVVDPFAKPVPKAHPAVLATLPTPFFEVLERLPERLFVAVKLALCGRADRRENAHRAIVFRRTRGKNRVLEMLPEMLVLLHPLFRRHPEFGGDLHPALEPVAAVFEPEVVLDQIVTLVFLRIVAVAVGQLRQDLINQSGAVFRRLSDRKTFRPGLPEVFKQELAAGQFQVAVKPVGFLLLAVDLDRGVVEFVLQDLA